MHLRIDEGASWSVCSAPASPEHSDDADGTSGREEVCATDTDCGPRLLVDRSHCGGFSVGEPELWVLGLPVAAAHGP